MFDSRRRTRKAPADLGPATETTLVDRVTRTRALLADAKTELDAMIALSEADIATLRELEAVYFHHPGLAATLRERIAGAHAEFARTWKSQALTTAQVTPDLFRRWAADTLSEWMPGHTDFREEEGGQYQITYLGAGRFTVKTAQGFGGKTFQVRIDVTEAS